MAIELSELIELLNKDLGLDILLWCSISSIVAF